MTAPITHVALLLDESSSMAPHKTTTLSALNEYIATLNQAPEGIHLTLVAFSSIRTHFIVRNVQLGPDIKVVVTDEMYQPSGSTPLIDAAMKLILAAEKKAQPGDKVIIALQTDGEENCSVEFKLEDLQRKIKEKSDEGWQFVFMGAGLDAYQAAGRYGISSGATMSYSTDQAKTMEAFRGLASNTRSYVSGQSVSMDWSDRQKDASGDVWRQQPVDPVKPADVIPVTDQKKSLVGDFDI